MQLLCCALTLEPNAETRTTHSSPLLFRRVVQQISLPTTSLKVRVYCDFLLPLPASSGP